MDIHNIAIVRATDILPIDGIVKPISSTRYIKKDPNTDFALKLKDYLKKIGIIPPLDFSKMDEDYFKEWATQGNAIAKSYLPYTSDYNSMVLFSLNGLVPDDCEKGFGNNYFSNKKCAIIDGLQEHIDEVVSLVPTDTALKGDIRLSKEAVVLIEKEFYDSLSEEEKLSLNQLNIKLFSGSLKDAIEDYLRNSNRYFCEELTLSKECRGVKKSETSDLLIAEIDRLSLMYQIPQVYFFNILTNQNDSLEKLESVKDERENYDIVLDHYLEKFYIFLLTALNKTSNLNIREFMHNANFIDKIIEYIDEYGIENYKLLVEKYNALLEQEKSNKTLLTPEEIVMLEKEKTNSY